MSRSSNAISADEARRIVIRAQGLAPTSDRPKTVAEVLRRTNAVQLDTISVLARSHELVAYARLGPVPRAKVEAAYWSEPATAFEYFAHANCVIPIEDWPWFHFRRGQLGKGAWPQLMGSPVFDEVKAALRDGPITASDVGGARKTAGWWNWSEAKQALEVMFARGEVVCATRRNWKRVYDLPERVVPADLLARKPSVEESYLHLVRQAARALGVGTARDIANYYMLLTSYMGRGLDRKRLFAGAMDASGLVRVAGRGLGRAGFRARGRAEDAAREGAPDDTAVAVRLADLGGAEGRERAAARPDDAAVRLRHGVRAVRPEGEARARLLHDAAARAREDPRPRGPRARRARRWSPATSSCTTQRRSTRWRQRCAKRRSGSAATASASTACSRRASQPR